MANCPRSGTIVATTSIVGQVVGYCDDCGRSYPLEAEPGIPLGHRGRLPEHELVERDERPDVTLLHQEARVVRAAIRLLLNAVEGEVVPEVDEQTRMVLRMIEDRLPQGLRAVQ